MEGGPVVRVLTVMVRLFWLRAWICSWVRSAGVLMGWRIVRRILDGGVNGRLGLDGILS